MPDNEGLTVGKIAKWGCVGAVITSPILLPYIAYKLTEKTIKGAGNYAKNHKVLTAVALTLGTGYYLTRTEDGRKLRADISQTYTTLVDKINEPRIKTAELARVQAEQKAELTRRVLEEERQAKIRAEQEKNATQAQQTAEQAEAARRQLAQAQYERDQAIQKYNEEKSKPPRTIKERVYVPQPVPQPAQQVPIPTQEAARNGETSRIRITQETHVTETIRTYERPPQPAPQSKIPRNYLDVHPSQLPREVEMPEFDNNDGCKLHIKVQRGNTLSDIVNWASRHHGTRATWQEARAKSMEYTPSYFAMPEKMPINAIVHVPY
jgi:hypothetical protein